ncbi:hypothetical protein C8A03DRAFT_35036 [Achaetomium macrosporum]|uniref:Uncharacterized protein n=1 Tax=Achaetomium macrosporum TaxID=79813 RepID=A0AAN7C8U2_9PEZI|nr:hypothetical protein C8A03DRAFT_35036 [Achaetomium macrosporum]
MDSPILALALVALVFILAVAGDAVSAAFANGFEMMSELIKEGRTVVTGVQLIFINLFVASMLAPYLVSLWGSLPTVASRARQVLESSIAGTTRRANLARESAITVAWGYINALKATTLAGILSWVSGRLVLPLLLFVARPFVPAILRKYFLWKNWAMDRAEDFVNYVCVDMEKRAERRRVREARELALAAQLTKLEQLNKANAKAYRNAVEAYQEGTRSVGWSHGKYEYLRPAPQAAPAAAVVPEDGPVERLGLWTRLCQRIDINVYWINQSIIRIDSAMARNKDSIAVLEVQLASRSKELEAIQDKILDCRAQAMLTWRKAQSVPSRAIIRPARQIEEESTRPSEDGSLHERVQAANRRALAMHRKSALVTTATTTTTTTTMVTTTNTASVHAPPADVPTTSTTSTTIATTIAEPTPSAVVHEVPPSSPTPEEILTIAAATPLPRTKEEIAIEKAHESIKQNYA